MLVLDSQFLEHGKKSEIRIIGPSFKSTSSIVVREISSRGGCDAKRKVLSVKV